MSPSWDLGSKNSNIPLSEPKSLHSGIKPRLVALNSRYSPIYPKESWQEGGKLPGAAVGASHFLLLLGV